MQLSLQNFPSLVNAMAASVQGACSSLINLTVGSVLRSVLEASASVALWLQYLLLQVLTMTRLATSVGADADSWVQDFGMTRLTATFATGQVVMTTFNSGAQGATIPNGATVRTSDGSQTFTVTGGPYTRPVGSDSVVVQVTATVAGMAGNVEAGAVNILGTAIPGIDVVSNPTAFSGGEEAESDAALRLRFVTFINTRSQATEQAIAYAITSVQQQLDFSIGENVLADGTFAPGHIQIVVDDGTGYPSQSLLNAVTTAANSVRPIGTSLSVAAPVVMTASINLLLTVDQSEDSKVIVGLVTGALTAYINAIGVGQPLRYSRLAGLCYGVAAVNNVENLLLNGSMVDLGGQAGTVVRCEAANISIATA